MSEVSEVFASIALLSHGRGARNIKDSPGTHKIEIDTRWSAEINPHRETIDNIPPFHMAITYNDWPAGLVHSVSGGVICAGELANEDTLLDAVRATARAEGIELNSSPETGE